MEKSYFVLTLPIRTETWQEDKLNKRFEVNCKIYNALLGGGLKRYAQMSQTRRYRELIRELDATAGAKERKAVYQKLDALVEEYRLRRYDLTKDAAKYRQYFKENTDAPVIQNLAVQAWKAIYAVISRQAREAHFRQEGELNCLMGKTNKTSIRYQKGMLLWKGLELTLAEKDNAYEKEALQQEIRYCRIKREQICGKYHFYAQIVLKGKCPIRKQIPVKNADTVGIDIGMRQIAVVSDHEVLLEALPRRAEELERKKIRLARKMERSRRVNHPENYEADGRIKKGVKFRKQSRHYKKLKNAYQEAGRRQQVLRKEQQRVLAEKLMQMGVCFHVEQLAYAKMAATGWMGKEVEAVALASFFTMLSRKMEQQGRKLVFLEPTKAMAGSINHVTGKREKPPYQKRYRNIGGYQVEKHLYSAFLLKNADETTSQVNLEKCRNEYSSFLRLCADDPAAAVWMVG